MGAGQLPLEARGGSFLPPPAPGGCRCPSARGASPSLPLSARGLALCRLLCISHGDPGHCGQHPPFSARPALNLTPALKTKQGRVPRVGGHQDCSVLSGGHGSVDSRPSRPSPSPASPLVATTTLNRAEDEDAPPGDQELVQGHIADSEDGSDSLLPPPPPSPGAQGRAVTSWGGPQHTPTLPSPGRPPSCPRVKQTP